MTIIVKLPFQHYFSYNVQIRFIGGGNRSTRVRRPVSILRQSLCPKDASSTPHHVRE